MSPCTRLLHDSPGIVSGKSQRVIAVAWIEPPTVRRNQSARLCGPMCPARTRKQEPHHPKWDPRPAMPLRHSRRRAKRPEFPCTASYNSSSISAEFDLLPRPLSSPTRPPHHKIGRYTEAKIVGRKGNSVKTAGGWRSLTMTSVAVTGRLFPARM